VNRARSSSLPTLLSLLLVASLTACSGFQAIDPDAGPEGGVDANSGRVDGPGIDAAGLDLAIEAGSGGCPGAPSSTTIGEATGIFAAAETALAIEATTGVMHLVYTMPGASDQRLLYRRRDATGAWSSPERLTEPGEAPDYPLLAVEPGGVVHLVYSLQKPTTDVIHERLSGGSWSRRVIPQAQRGGGDLALDAGGELHLLTTGGEIRYQRFDASWQPSVLLEDKVPSRSHRVGLALSNSRAHAVYCDDSGALKLRRESTGGAFEAARLLASGLDVDSCGAHIAIDRAGVTHVVYAVTDTFSQGTLRYLRGDASLTFEAAQELGTLKPHALEYGGYHALAADKQLWVIGVAPDRKLRLFSRPLGGSWAPALDLSWLGDRGIAAALDGDGALRISHWDSAGQRPRVTTVCP
jgi:hypothetical protein